MKNTIIINNGLSEAEFYIDYLMNVGRFAPSFEEERGFRAGIELVLKYLGHPEITKRLLALECFESPYTNYRPNSRQKIVQHVVEFLDSRNRQSSSKMKIENELLA